MPKFVVMFVVLFAFGAGGFAWYVLRGQDGFPEMARRAFERQGAKNAGNQILVEVAGQPITTADMEWEYQAHLAGLLEDPELEAEEPGLDANDDEGSLDPLKKRLVAALVERRVLYEFIKKDQTFDLSDAGRYAECTARWQEAIVRQPKLLSTEFDKQRFKERLCEQSILTQYLKERVNAAAVVSEEEIVQFFEDNPQKFDRPERVKIRQIVLADDSEARRVRNRATRDNFAELARAKSIAPEASEGGLLGPFAKGEMPRVFDTAFDMRVGAISDVLKSTYGFHVIMVIDKLPAAKLTLDEARPAIEEHLIRSKREQAYEHWVEQALATISVKTPRTLW